MGETRGEDRDPQFASKIKLDDPAHGMKQRNGSESATSGQGGHRAVGEGREGDR